MFVYIETAYNPACSICKTDSGLWINRHMPNACVWVYCDGKDYEENFIRFFPWFNNKPYLLCCVECIDKFKLCPLLATPVPYLRVAFHEKPLKRGVSPWY